MSRERISRHFDKQAAGCERLGSPFTGRICRAVSRILDGDGLLGRRVWNWPNEPGPDALALRVCGGLHALALAGDEVVHVYPPHESDDETLDAALKRAVERHDAWLAKFIESPPQTNEIARSAMLLPGLLAVARETGLPLKLAEIGSSAGLNLNLDRFFYRYGNEEWGDPRSPVQLSPTIVGGLPPLDGVLAIAGREGSDIAPVDTADASARQRLRAYVWADQPSRLARLDAAVELFLAHPSPIRAEAADDFVRRRLASRADGEVFVLFHSIMWQYMPDATREAIAAMMAEAGETAATQSPVAWLRMEPVAISDPHATLSLTLWPGGRTRALARCDFHGRSFEWLGDD